MRILVTGTNGFIAREIIARLATADHEIIACIHNKALKNIPYSNAFRKNFIKATTPADWLPHLKHIDVIINCVGVFHTVKEKTIWTIHYTAPKALFDAALKQGVKKIIQISALGVDKVNVPYAASKLALDNYLESLDIESVIIRPGLVYGKGSYGGSSLFRGLAGFPFIIPVPGAGKTLQQPIHMDDLTTIVEKALTIPGKEIITAVGEEQISIKNLLTKLRAWLGFKKAWSFAVPNLFIHLASKLGNCIPNSPLSETGTKMMSVDNVASDTESAHLKRITGLKPRGLTDGLKGMVSSVQDRWHARLYFLRPMLRLSIAFIWLFSGILSFLPRSLPYSHTILTEASIPSAFQCFIILLFGSIDILLGLATLFNYRLLLVGFLQCLMIAFYTLVISILLPTYWLYPFAPIAKNIPILVAILTMMALESDR